MGQRYVLAAFIQSKRSKLIITEQLHKLKQNKRTLEILRILEFFDVCLAKFNRSQILYNKICYQIEATTKLFIWRRDFFVKKSYWHAFTNYY